MRTVHPRPSQVLTFSRNYVPGTRFQVVDRLPQAVVAWILGRKRGGDPVIWDTTDYEASLVTDRVRGNTPGEYFLVFVDGTLQNEQQYAFGAEAVFFASHLALIEVSISTVEATPTPVEKPN